MAKRVRVKETGEIYNTVKEAAEAVGGSSSGVVNQIAGRIPRHAGHTFEYAGSREDGIDPMNMSLSTLIRLVDFNPTRKKRSNF